MTDGISTTTTLVCDSPDVPDRVCSVEGCVRVPRSRHQTLCDMHYRRLRMHGSVGGAEALKKPTAGVPCSVEGCDRRRASSSGLCLMHYQRFIRNGAAGSAEALRKPAAGVPCSVDGCNRTTKSKGLCNLHYDRLLKGKPVGGPDRLVARPYVDCECSVDGCKGTVRALGYCGLHYARHLNGRPIGGVGRLVARKGEQSVCSVADCNRIAESLGHCNLHRTRSRRGIPLDAPIRGASPSRCIDENGYVDVQVPEGTPGAYKKPTGTRWLMLEHRYVMQQKLGRPIQARIETVHHINGNRQDNRIENLELWSSRHPSGQRVQDKVAFAIEMLTLYPMFIGLDLVDQAALKTILDRVRGIGENSATRKRSIRRPSGSA
jgi:HNH endonuclease